MVGVQRVRYYINFLFRLFTQSKHSQIKMEVCKIVLV